MYWKRWAYRTLSNSTITCIFSIPICWRRSWLSCWSHSPMSANSVYREGKSCKAGVWPYSEQRLHSLTPGPERAQNGQSVTYIVVRATLGLTFSLGMENTQAHLLCSECEICQWACGLWLIGAYITFTEYKLRVTPCEIWISLLEIFDCLWREPGNIPCGLYYTKSKNN